MKSSLRISWLVLVFALSAPSFGGDLTKARCKAGDEGCVAGSQESTVLIPDHLLKKGVPRTQDLEKKSTKIAPIQGPVAPPYSATGPADEWSDLQRAMWVQVTHFQKSKPVNPDKLCEQSPHLCADYQACLKNAKLALEKSEKSCPLPSQDSDLQFWTPIPQERARKCAAIVLAGELLMGRKGLVSKAKSRSKDKVDSTDESLASLSEPDVDDESKTEDTPGDHKAPVASRATKKRSPASAINPVYEACGEEKSPLTARMENGKLLPHSVYQITVRTMGDRWMPSASGEKTECLRILTDQHGDIRGRMVITGFAGQGKERTRVRSRFLGRQLPNPDGKLLPNRVYDAFMLPGGKQKFIFAACENQKDYREPLVSLIQASPTTMDEVQLVGLKFVGEKTDPAKKLAFTDASPSELQFALPKILGSPEALTKNDVTRVDDVISMAAFVEDKL